MKNTIIGIGTTIFFAVIVLVLFIQVGKSHRQTELENGLTTGMESAMKMLSEDTAYAPQSNEEFVADFLQAFLLAIDSSSDVTVNVLDADYQKGLLSVEAVMSYTYPNGNVGSVSSRKTLILEHFGDSDSENMCTVNFMVDGELYESFTVKRGSAIYGVQDPSGKEMVGFSHWEDLETGDTIDPYGYMVEKDMTIVAVAQEP